MKYLDPGQYLLSPTPSNEEQIQEESFRNGFSKVMAALSGRKSRRGEESSEAPEVNHLSQSVLPPPFSKNHHSQLISEFRQEETIPEDSDMETDTERDLEINVERSVSPETSSSDFSTLLSLPLEILHYIIELVYYDNNTASISSNLENFSKTMPLLSKTMNALSLRFLYKYAIFNRPHSFDKFLHNLISNPDLGYYVEFMDFQQFTSIGLGRTGRMNQEIQMVTSDTIFTALSLTPNLLEFLSSENIQDDMDVRVLDCLFNRLKKLEAIDFCGASSEQFARAFQELVITTGDEKVRPTSSTSLSSSNRGISSTFSSSSTLNRHNFSQSQPSLGHLFKISFHDCSNLVPETYSKILPHLVNLRRLDLNHTSITSALLNQYMPTTARLTHLSLARCSKLTTRDLIQYLTQHPSVASGSLKWLSLQTDSNVVSPLSDTYLLFTLRNLNAPDLRFINLGGLPVDKKHLQIIRQRFPNLRSLAISHAPGVDINDVNEFLHNNANIRYIDLTGCKRITRADIPSILRNCFYSAEKLIAIEFDYKLLMDLTAGDYIKISPQQQSFLDPPVAPQIWKFYDNEGRRSWIYQVESTDPFYKSIINSNGSYSARNSSISNLTYYDIETGKKITQKYKKPDFLKYVSRKICCSIGYHRLDDSKKKSYIAGKLEESVWPAEFSQRGIYNYYSLNVK
ncbi:hypothetical protein CLIB1423_11S04280 [[Candida] railenensis]|uniref:F-box domain-containing protein n=1 Tax=[Candida] railenensis TaxID=45579 RepID=A0A9P0VZK4_9ASCO|nr:hypothetical protein CLIB1423_11S04280 [[Candida] railenensis]